MRVQRKTLSKLYHQRGDHIMPQGILSFKYEEEKNSSGMTSLAGLPTYLDLSYAAGLVDSIKKNIRIKGKQGWTDNEIVMSLILLNLAGGDCVNDLRILEGDQGFVEVFKKTQTYKMSGSEKRAYKKRWHKEKLRGIPSPSTVFRFLTSFHNFEEGKNREAHKAYIPTPNEHLQGLIKINIDLMKFIHNHKIERNATLDMDATLIETDKEEALYCYKGFKAYQPLNVYWAEYDAILYSEFRDGNVPAGYEQLRVMKEAISFLPESVKKVYMRSDTAGYQQELLKYCAEGRDEKFGVIEFAIGADVTTEFKKAVSNISESEWNSLERNVEDKKMGTGQEWAEVCFVPSWAGNSKKGPDYRFLAIREPIRQLNLPGMNEQIVFPFQTMDFSNKGKYKIFGVVTNRDIPGDELIWWHRGRCGKSEEAHSVMKEDLAGGKLPSGSFGENAAWWAIMILAFNLNSAMKHMVLGGNWVTKRLKAIRYAFINLPGRIIKRSRELIVRLTGGHISNEILFQARGRILCLLPDPSG